jgi:hypothetical protein
MGWMEDFNKGASDFFNGKDNDKINAALTPTCSTTNQGSTMDDIRAEIVKINNVTKDIIAKARNEIANYGVDLPLLDLINTNNQAETTYQKQKTANDKLQSTNDATEQKYIAEQTQLSNDIDGLNTTIKKLVSELNGHTTDINNLDRNEILPRISQIKGDYTNISNNITENDKAAILSNNNRNDRQQASFSIAYLEFLLMDAYKQIYRSIYYENVSAKDGIEHRNDTNMNQFSINNYQNHRIQFYKNINTFLFYFYYVMIIALVIVVLKYNSTSLLIKLTFFRIFAIILILYPLFIIPFQHFIYKFFTYLFSKL